MARGDFVTSTSLLLELCKEGITEPFVAKLLEYEEHSAPSLRFRDHVFSFLGLTPFYCAIQASSSDVLRRFSGIDDLGEIQEKAFTWSKELLESNNPLISLKYLESERVLTTGYAYALPSILERKALEIESCRIPVSPDEDHICVIPLNDTFYGHRLLIGLGERFIPPEKPTGFFYRKLILTRREWEPVRECLANLGYEPSAMLLGLDEREWSDVTGHLLRESRRSHPSKEVASVRQLYDCALVLSLSYDEEMAHRIATFGSNYANRELMNYVRGPKGEVRFSVVKALTDSGDPAILDFLSGLISDVDERSKGVIARGISSLASTMSRFLKDPPGAQKRSPIPAETTSVLLRLEKLSRHPNTSLRIDALRALASFRDPRAHNLLYNAFAADQSKLIRSEIVSLTKKLPREASARILKMALEDSHQDIVTQAEMTILLLGGDFLHESLDEDEHELN